MSAMDKYRRVIKDSIKEPIADNEIRITLKGKIRNYITYALALLQEKSLRVIKLKAMGGAISKQVMVTEVIKRRVAGLHQINEISSIEVTDDFEPLEEGLDKVTVKRLITSMEIILSLDELDKTNVGYQPPVPESQVLTSEQAKEKMKKRFQKSTRGRRSRGNNGRNSVENNQKIDQTDSSNGDDNKAVEEDVPPTIVETKIPVVTQNITNNNQNDESVVTNTNDEPEVKDENGNQMYQSGRGDRGRRGRGRGGYRGRGRGRGYRGRGRGYRGRGGRGGKTNRRQEEDAGDNAVEE